MIWYETGVTGTVGRLILTPPAPWVLYSTVLGSAGRAGRARGGRPVGDRP